MDTFVTCKVATTEDQSLEQTVDVSKQQRTLDYEVTDCDGDRASLLSVYHGPNVTIKGEKRTDIMYVTGRDGLSFEEIRAVELAERMFEMLKNNDHII